MQDDKQYLNYIHLHDFEIVLDQSQWLQGQSIWGSKGDTDT